MRGEGVPQVLRDAVEFGLGEGLMVHEAASLELRYEVGLQARQRRVDLREVQAVGDGKALPSADGVREYPGVFASHGGHFVRVPVIATGWPFTMIVLVTVSPTFGSAGFAGAFFAFSGASPAV